MRLEILETAALAIVEQADYYEQKSGHDLAERWEAAVDHVIHQLLRWPQMGSPAHFRSSRLVGLRWIRIPDFPKHLVFYRYFQELETVQIMHLLHGARDLQSLLEEGD